jgi:hypothetical protein
MKSTVVVKMDKGWYVTRKYCGRTIETRFFACGTKKSERLNAEKEKNDYVAKWAD